MAVDEPDAEMPEAPPEPEAPVVEPPPEPEIIEEPEPFEDPWVAIDPHENVVKGRPLKVGKTVAKAPARLYRPLAEMSLTDPFEQSDMWNLIPQRGLLRKLGLEEFEDCEARVLAEISRRRSRRRTCLMVKATSTTERARRRRRKNSSLQLRTRRKRRRSGLTVQRPRRCPPAD